MEKVIRPAAIIDIDVNAPVIFLAGPIKGACQWQKRAISTIQGMSGEIFVANPRREYGAGEFNFDAQVDWETHFLRRAATKGVILFWLANEQEHDCSRPYAQTSRFELAEWKMKHEYENIQLVVGIEEGFTGAGYITRRLSQDCPNVPICSSLEETCRKAVELAVGSE